MNALRSIEVEPLGDQRWEKIECSLLTRAERVRFDADDCLGHPGRSRAAPAMLVAVALVGVVGFATFGTHEQPQRAGIEAPSRIATGPNPSHLALAGLTLDVEPHSLVVVGAETSQGLLVVLDRGSIVCQVAPRAKDKPLIVQAGGARVRVLGTRFSVSLLGETARVKVEHGVVEVLSGGGTWRVAGGQEWPPAAPGPRPLVDVPAPASAASSVEVRRQGSASSRPPLSEAPQRPVTRSRSLPVPSATPGEVFETMPAPTPALSRQDVFEQAAALERDDPARAARLYGTLESGGDSWAQNALYARGRLAAARGNRAAASRLLAQYLERFPQGSNAEDARAVLQRLR